MNDPPENHPDQGKATFVRFPVFPLVAVCVIVIVVALGMVIWWGTDPSSVDPAATLHEFPAEKGTAASFPGAPGKPSIQGGGPPAFDHRSTQTGGTLSPAGETARSERSDAETAALRANPPTLLEAMMRTQTEQQGKPGQMSGEGSVSSAASPFRHDRGGKQ